jgi:hypothetical protein
MANIYRVYTKCQVLLIDLPPQVLEVDSGHHSDVTYGKMEEQSSNSLLKVNKW